MERNKNIASSQQLLNKLKQGNIDLLDEIYLDHRPAFINWMRKQFKLGDEDIADLYQDTVISFYNAVKSGRLEQLTVPVQSYFFSIGKNLALKRHRQMRIAEKHEENIKEMQLDVEDPFSDEKEERVDAIKVAFQKMGEPCHSLLKLYYYQRMQMNEVALQLNYKNADVAKSQKSRCMKKLKALVKQLVDE